MATNVATDEPIPDTGNLIVTKKVTESDGTESTDNNVFKFDIEFTSDNAGTTAALAEKKDYGDVTVENGKGSFYLSNGQQVKMTGLPAGISYKITEAENTDYEVSWTADSGVITKDAETTAICVNKKKPKEEVKRQSLTVKKEVKEAKNGAEESFVFHAAFEGLEENAEYKYKKGEAETVFSSDETGAADVSFELKDKESVIFEGLPVGSKYQITEDGNSYAASYELTDFVNAVQQKQNNDEVNKSLSTGTEIVDADENAVVTFINTGKEPDVPETKTTKIRIKKVWSDNESKTRPATFDKFLVMDSQANVPNATFSYAVTAGNAKAYSVADKKFQVLAGVDADKITMAGVGEGAEANKIVFKQGDGSDTHDTTKDKYVKDLAAGKKYALKTATLDFSKVQFTEPGVYRYVITESGTNQAITNDADLTRVLDVYVNDASTDTDGALTKKLTIAGYVLHSNENDEPDVAAGADFGSAGAYVATKSQGFTNSYDTSDLTLRKQVTGNQASRDKYFEFTLNIDKAQPNTKYDVVIDDADATSKANAATIDANAGQANVTSITTDGAGKATQKFYLQHGQQITVQGLAKDTTYAVTENTEDYKSTANTAAAPVVDVKADTISAEVNGTIASKDLTTGYLNTRDGVIPTGVIMAVAPFAVVTILGGAGVVTMVMKKNKKEDE